MRIPGAPSFVGSALASGVLLSGPRARERALALWSPESRVHAVGDRLLVLFGTPRRLRAHTTPGALVCAAHGVLSSVPLEEKTVRALDPLPGALVVAEGGALVVHTLEPASELRPHTWLDLAGLDFVEATSLGPEPERAAPPPAISRDVRAAIGEKIPERVEAAPTLAELARAEGAARSGAMPPGEGWLAGLARWLRGLFAARAPAPAPSAGTALAPPKPSWLDRVRGWLARQVMRSQLSRFLAQRQAEYVARMLELFDRDVHEALKWAIPLGSDAGTPAPPSLALPTPRAQLTIGAPRATTSSIGFPGLYELLRQRYLAILARLQESGSIDEAAFVLAELLRDPAGAVALLERHGRYLQAARLADASDLEVPVRIRTWMLAGDVRRAVQIARRDGGMAVAITMLRRTHPKVADALAISWASARAEAGDYVEAVEEAHKIADARLLVERWLELALESGGAPGARMLARRAAFSPGKWDDTRARTLALLDDDSAEHAPSRLAFSTALSQAEPTPAVRTLARAALRALVRDGLPANDTGLVDRLLSLTQDGALRADRPSSTLRGAALRRLTDRASPLVIHVEASDVGALPVLDAALLPSGRLVLALGDAGVRVVGADGRRVHVLDLPADQLVISSTGTRALAVARAGVLHRVGRVDLALGRAERWWEAQLVAFAPTFDGSGWLVAERDPERLDGSPAIIDVLDTGWSALARVDLKGCLRVVHDGALGECVLLVADGEGLDVLRYDLALSRLRSRKSVPLPEDARPMRVALGADLWAILAREEDHALGFLSMSGTSYVATLPGPPAQGNALVISAGLIACASKMSDGVRVDVRTAMGRELAHVLLDGADAVNLRLASDVLVIADDRGRVIALDVVTGGLLRDLRIRL